MHVLAVTTYNRISFLKKLISSFHRNTTQPNWHIIIADDGSTDGTIQYIEQLKIPNIPITLIKNNRQGVHHQFNTIIRQLEVIDFYCCFKCDDDIEFLKPGWEQLYLEAIEQSGYHHLCHFDPTWRPDKNLKPPVQKGNLISYCKGKDVQGAFFTLTPDVIKKVGYMDVKNFGFRGVGHIDYTLRACRAGFNDTNNPFDVKNSNSYIQHQRDNYSSALNVHLQNALESDLESKRKYQLIDDETRSYISYFRSPKSLTTNLEMELLKSRIEALEKEKEWYESTYGHQPRWYVRFGKLMKLLKIFR